MSLTTYEPPTIETIEPGEAVAETTAILPLVIAIAGVSWVIAVKQATKLASYSPIETPANEPPRLVILPPVEARDEGQRAA